MKTKDHKIMAKHLLNCADIYIVKSLKAAFILGNIEPDRNPFTYLRGSIKNQMLRGHNFDNSYESIVKLVRRIQLHGCTRMRDFYLLGKLTHYVADAFTFPHNKEFTGGLLEHCNYESTLHLYVMKFLEDENVKVKVNITSDVLIQKICLMHQKYLQEEKGFSLDCSYIMQTVCMVMEYFVGEEKVWILG